MATGKKECGDKLYEGGKVVAVCTQERFTEHCHSDRTATEALAAGLAKKRRLLIVDVEVSKS